MTMRRRTEGGGGSPPKRLILNVLRIPACGEREECGELAPEALDLGRDPLARAGGTILWRLRGQFAGHEILVRGEARAPVKLRCARCGCFFSTSVEVSSFLRAYERAENPVELDVTEDLREEILLAIPAFPRCRPGCKGRCAQCGKDLNEGPCGCVPPQGFNAWSALDHLVLRDEAGREGSIRPESGNEQTTDTQAQKIQS